MHSFPHNRETSFPLNARIDLMDDEERQELLHMIDFAKQRRELHEPLYQLVTRGPVWDGDLISKNARDELLDIQACAKIWAKGEDGYQAATYLGGYLLKIYDWLHGSLGKAA